MTGCWAASALWGLVLLPTGIGAVLLLGSGRLERPAAAISVLTSVTVLALSILVAALRPSIEAPFILNAPFALDVDGLAALMVVAVAAVTLLVLAFSAAEVREDPARFHGFMLVFLGAVLLVVTAASLPALFLGWEMMGAMSYALIGFQWRERHRVHAGQVAFLTTMVGDLGLYVAAGAALAGGAGLGLADLAFGAPGWRDLAAAGLLIAAIAKAAQLPLSAWLSAAMEGPSPVSALLHSAAMVAMGGYLLLRVDELLAVTGWAASAAAWVGALTALLLGIVAVAQRDLKQLLAASTASQLGFVVLAAGVSAVAGGAAQLVAHAATKALLFLVAGAWLAALGTKQLPALTGASRRWPLLGACSVVGALTLAGMAPFSLWATKDSILSVTREVSLPLYAVGSAAAVISAMYAGKVLFFVLRPVAADESGLDDEQQGSRHVPRLASWSVVPLAVAAAVLGLLVLPPVAPRLWRLVGSGASPESGWVEPLIAAVVALLVVSLVMRFGAPQWRWAQSWLGLPNATQTIVIGPVLRTADALAAFDDRVLDRGVQSVARYALKLGDRAGAFDIHGIDAAVGRVAASARRLGQLVRMPQTGQVHEYYVGVVAVLALGAVLLLVVR